MKTTYMHALLAQWKKLEQHRYYLALLSLISSVCFWLAWPPNCCTPLLFVAFVPLLLMERHIAKHPYKRPYRTFYKYGFLTLFLWNLTTTWWVAYATGAGAVFMLLGNTLCMSLPLPLFQWTTKYQKQVAGYLSLVAYWVSMEYIHLQWELSFPWLNVGNGFAHFPAWVQWYEYTGALGGTIWVLTANILLGLLLIVKTKVWRKVAGIAAGIWILLPILYSYYTYVHYSEQGEEVEVVVMQPNINPNTGAFVDTGEVPSIAARVERFIELSATQLTEKTQFLVWPEIAIDSLFDEQVLGDYLLIDRLVKFRQRYPQLSLLTGINSLVGYTEKATRTARFSDQYGYYDVFNTALFVGNQGTLETYHKSKLVPGAEIIPYLYSIKLPEILTPGLGGTLRSMGRQAHPSVFVNARGMGIAPIICYESVYGDHLAAFVRKGAALIFSMTIDGWWKNTPGYRQHFHYTRLRAIESRRSIARSALQGISAFINQRGDVLQATRYEDQAALRHTLQANTALTFYAQYSDYIPMVPIGASCVFILLVIIGRKIEEEIRMAEEAAKAAQRQNQPPWH